GAVRGVSVNGRPGKAFEWVAGAGPSAVLKVASLGLNATEAAGTELCYRLAAPCASLEQLCFNEGQCRRVAGRQ
ncbi:hypothetical protein TSOC_015393, partial [Tetrabaena socialis]